MERNNKFSLFNHSRIFGIFGIFSRKKSNEHSDSIPNTAWCFCPRNVFFSKSQVRLLPLIRGESGTENPELFLQATFHYLRVAHPENTISVISEILGVLHQGDAKIDFSHFDFWADFTGFMVACATLTCLCLSIFRSSKHGLFLASTNSSSAWTVHGPKIITISDGHNTHHQVRYTHLYRQGTCGPCKKRTQEAGPQYLPRSVGWKYGITWSLVGGWDQIQLKICNCKCIEIKI